MDTGCQPVSDIMLVGCECGNSKVVSKEADHEYGQYYVVIECEECGYYWEGYMGYVMDDITNDDIQPKDDVDYPVGKVAEVYVLETNDRASVQAIKETIEKMKEKNEIPEDKYKAIINRCNEGWVILDALSFSDKYSDIISEFKDVLMRQHASSLRIVKGICTFDEHGIAISDFDYLRTSILECNSLLFQSLFRIIAC